MATSYSPSERNDDSPFLLGGVYLLLLIAIAFIAIFSSSSKVNEGQVERPIVPIEQTIEKSTSTEPEILKTLKPPVQPRVQPSTKVPTVKPEAVVDAIPSPTIISPLLIEREPPMLFTQPTINIPSTPPSVESEVVSPQNVTPRVAAQPATTASTKAPAESAVSSTEPVPHSVASPTPAIEDIPPFTLSLSVRQYNAIDDVWEPVVGGVVSHGTRLSFQWLTQSQEPIQCDLSSEFGDEVHVGHSGIKHVLATFPFRMSVICTGETTGRVQTESIDISILE